MDEGVTRPAEIFGMHVFDKAAMKERLPEDVYRRLMTAVEGDGKLDGSIADYVAAAMKEWALSKGATHYTHWFQPRTEVTAERHMAFLNLDGEGHPIHTFSGKELIQSEPDASSFPSGGMRNTFEARGYCTWDPSSPAFIVLSHKGGTLCIPSVFISYDGTPLDMKTPLLKSIGAIQERAMRLLKLFGNRTVRSVDVTIGAEQEYFLVDEEKARRRPDIELCRRTLIGAPSPKAQAVEAHYLGAIHPRVLAFMEDVERDMYRLGQVLITRHNEVAPGQFEFAPVLSEANQGCDQNQMLMEVMRKMARRHHFQLLLHEKPFASVNGSGKHLNVSLRDSEGRNLLKPTSNPRRNVQFLSFIASFLLGVSRHGGLLRASIASAGNSHRLGGHEAPPAIMSVYVGSQIDRALNGLAQGLNEDMTAKGSIDLGLDRLPTLNRDVSDRNRTSPIAFTGNKWEFRGVGAPQALGGPLTVMLAAWSEGIERFCTALESRLIGGADVADAALAVIKDAWEESANVRFEGNGYDAAWIEEAKRRGLPVCRNTVEALDQYLIREHRDLLANLGIMTDREIVAYHEVRLEQYNETMLTEIGVLRAMMFEGVLPAISKQLACEAGALSALPVELRAHIAPWEKNLKRLAEIKCGILEKLEMLDAVAGSVKDGDAHAAAKTLAGDGASLMESIRADSDEAERLIAKELWPYPTYTDMFRIEDFKL
ncbi:MULTISPECIES: glutamine synthetase III [unclassified Pyramidobacter]|uniref:glutamine synthetase III n=1 Tax=unclassified Pyramidobacter TaxID=2632171 RepID=UPI000EA361C7|nr:glutamine synthetase III [Pyramidobacter sp. CG50-2]RKJ77493.1 glutamine synthetase type III [Pyramidobacter sp. CG50-2]